MNENELIVDMFAGVGPFSIQIAKLNNIKIYAFDVNPQAYHFLKKNIEMNKLKGKISPFNIDIKKLLNPSDHLGKLLSNTIDRIIMNLPKNSINYLDVVCFLMKKTGGILHFYSFSEKPNPIERVVKILVNKLKNLNWTIVQILNSKIVKSYSPKAELIVLDLRIKHLGS